LPIRKTTMLCSQTENWQPTDSRHAHGNHSELLKRYTHLFFDLDHTLWDYNRNSAIILEQLYIKYRLSKTTDFTIEQFLECFHETNEELWDRFHVGEISKEDIRVSRFETVFKKLGDYRFLFTKEFSDEFIRECPAKGHVIPGALELLDYLSGVYELHIITNGFEDIQHIKLSTTGLEQYFDKIFISGIVGYRKPERGIFIHALNKTGGLPVTSLMIGDSLEGDIKGAKSVPMDQVYFNPKRKPHTEDVTHEIQELLELKYLL